MLNHRLYLRPSELEPLITSPGDLHTHYILRSTAAAAKSLQSCPTLWDPIDGSPPGSPIPGILQARTLECVAIFFSNAWKWKVKGKSLSRVRLLATHGLQPTRLLCPWDFPGKSTGVGCHCLLRWEALDQNKLMTQTHCPLQSSDLSSTPGPKRLSLLEICYEPGFGTEHKTLQEIDIFPWWPHYLTVIITTFYPFGHTYFIWLSCFKGIYFLGLPWWLRGRESTC